MNKTIYLIKLVYGICFSNIRIYFKIKRFPNRYDLQMYRSLIRTGLIWYNVTHGIQKVGSVE